MQERLVRCMNVSEMIPPRVKVARLLNRVIFNNKVWRDLAEKWWAGKERDGMGEIPDDIKLQWEGDAEKWIDEVVQIKNL
jgi:hypothetical protein